MSGTSQFFNAAYFRDRIKFVWTMGAPGNNDAPVFHFAPVVTTSAALDGDGVPFDPAQNPVETYPAPVSVVCGTDWSDHTDEPTAFGSVIPAVLIISVFEAEYDLIKDATYLMIGPDKYLYDHEEPAGGLFDVTIYNIVFLAENVT